LKDGVVCSTPRDKERRKLDGFPDDWDRATAVEEIEVQFHHSVLPMTLASAMDCNDRSSNTGVIEYGSAARREEDGICCKLKFL
jgi:hypothetical protein